VGDGDVRVVFQKLLYPRELLAGKPVAQLPVFQVRVEGVALQLFSQGLVVADFAPFQGLFSRNKLAALFCVGNSVILRSYLGREE
jgi:hypothetical protein